MSKNALKSFEGQEPDTAQATSQEPAVAAQAAPAQANPAPIEVAPPVVPAAQNIGDIITAAIAAGIKLGQQQTQVDAPKDEPALPTAEEDRKAMRDANGDVLRCSLTVSRRDGQHDTFGVVINEEKFWITRGEKVNVPWYVVLHLLNNIERKFKQVPDPANPGKKTTIPLDSPSEPISWNVIGQQHPENPNWLD